MTHNLDLKGVICPLNFVKTKLKLEEINSGEVLEVFLDDGEPVINVPRSVAEEGHEVLSVKPVGNRWLLTIKKK